MENLKIDTTSNVISTPSSLLESSLSIVVTKTRTRIHYSMTECVALRRCRSPFHFWTKEM
jgi:hypothetical protein